MSVHPSFRPSFCAFVCHTRESRQNGWRYLNMLESYHRTISLVFEAIFAILNLGVHPEWVHALNMASPVDSAAKIWFDQYSAIARNGAIWYVLSVLSPTNRSRMQALNWYNKWWPTDLGQRRRNGEILPRLVSSS